MARVSDHFAENKHRIGCNICGDYFFVRRINAIFDAYKAEIRQIMYIYSNPNWPILEWDSEKLLPLLSFVRNLGCFN